MSKSHCRHNIIEC